MSVPEEHLSAVRGLLGEPEPPKEETPTGEAEEDPRDIRIRELETKERELLDRLHANVSHVSKILESSTERRVENKKEEAPPDFDNMTPAQFAKYTIDTVREEIGTLRQETGFEIVKMRLEGQLEALNERDPEGFQKHADDIVRIMKDKGGKITPAEALTLAKAEARGNAPSEEEKQPVRRVAPTGTPPGRSTSSKPAPPPANARLAAEKNFKTIFKTRG